MIWRFFRGLGARVASARKEELSNHCCTRRAAAPSQTSNPETLLCWRRTEREKAESPRLARRATNLTSTVCVNQKAQRLAIHTSRLAPTALLPSWTANAYQVTRRPHTRHRLCGQSYLTKGGGGTVVSLLHTDATEAESNYRHQQQ